MAAQDLHGFLEAFSRNEILRRRLACDIDSAGPSADLLEIIADFASGIGYEIDARDLLALDTALTDVAGQSAPRIVRHLEVFSLDYLRGCHDPKRYSRLGVYDPEKRHLWKAY